RPFDALFGRHEGQVSFLESPDIGVHFYDIVALRQPLYPLMNAGIIEAPKPDLSRAQEIFQSLHRTWHVKGTGTNPWLWEQTAYSYLYPRLPHHIICRSSVYTPRFREDLRRTTVRHERMPRPPAAYHLVRGYKDHAGELVERASNGRVAQITTIPASL